MRCLLEFQPFLAVTENFSKVIELDDLAFLWRLVELLPIEARRCCETTQLPMPCRARRVFSGGRSFVIDGKGRARTFRVVLRTGRTGVLNFSRRRLLRRAILDLVTGRKMRKR